MRSVVVLRLLPVPLLAVALYACHAGSESSGASKAAVGSATDDSLLSIDAMIARAKTRDYWPDATTDWRELSATDQATLMASPACADFANFVFPPADTDQNTANALGISVDDLAPEQQAPRTDGLIAVQNGQIVYENYVGPYAGHPEYRHSMWSASKSFTTGLFGALIQEAESGDPAAVPTLSGNALSLSTTLGDLADVSALNPDPKFAALTVEQFLSMAPNLVWNEGYDGDISTSNVVGMLYQNGQDMASYASNLPFGPEGPGNRFNYSSGNAVILMRALQSLYGAKYDTLPWDALFSKLGMTSAVFERDMRGVFIGSSYVHLTLRDLARFGYAYLNGGFFGGQQVIDPGVVQDARVIGQGMLASGTTGADITEEESFYSTGWWINPDPSQLASQGLKTFDTTFPQTSTDGLQPGQKFFPDVPTDVFFAAGHYGQNIFAFPQDDLLIVRMSHDNEYFSKMDRMMAGARACFVNAYNGAVGPKGPTTAPSQTDTPSDVELNIGAFALQSGVFNVVFAKEMCSCQFVDGLSLSDCEAHDNLPSVAHQIVNIVTDPVAKTVTSSYLGHDTIAGLLASVGVTDFTVGGSASAMFDTVHPERGCVLTSLPNGSTLDAGAPPSPSEDAGSAPPSSDDAGSNEDADAGAPGDDGSAPDDDGGVGPQVRTGKAQLVEGRFRVAR
jgi:CubicO group peptidase (beta-lactamase class C family)